MKLNAMLGTLALSAVFLSSCKNETTPNPGESTSVQEEEPTTVVVKSVLTAEDQASMSTDEIIGRLQKGNENFVNNNLT